MTEADTWFQFVEQVAGLRAETVERNPILLREVQARAFEYLYETNPYETISELTQQIAELTEKVGRTNARNQTKSARGTTTTRQRRAS
jgi:uncharacterized small protein (DUF1192 family)